MLMNMILGVPKGFNTIFNCNTNKLNNDSGCNIYASTYTFTGLSIEELIYLSKDEKTYIEKIFERINPYLSKISRNNYNIKDLTTFDIYTSLTNSTYRSLVLFNPNKGNFVHLLRRILKLSLSYCKSLVFRKYFIVLKNIGRRVTSLEENINSLKCEFEEKLLQRKIDLERYKQYLSKEEKKLIILYSAGLNFTDIASLTNQTKQSVSKKFIDIAMELKNSLARKQL